MRSFFLSLLLFLFGILPVGILPAYAVQVPGANVQHDLAMGMACAVECNSFTDAGCGNPECHSNDCEDSSKEEADDNFCDCDDNADCANEYGTQAGETWECVGGGYKTYDLDYCQSSIRGPQYPIQPREASAGAFLTDKNLAADEIQQLVFNKPVTQISIPGVSFSEPRVFKEDGVTFLHIPFLGEYIAALYKYFIAVVVVVAIVKILDGAIIMVMSRGESDKVTHGKETIGAAIIGLIIAVTSYSILYMVNPNLVQFKSLKVKFVEREDIADFLLHGDVGSDEQASFSGSGTQWTIPGTNETVELSTKDVCFFNTFGKDQKILDNSIGKAFLFGPSHCINVHKLIAAELQSRFDELARSNDATIIEWRKHLLDTAGHIGSNKKPYDPIRASGAWSAYGHGSDRNFIDRFGVKYGIGNGGGGIAVTAKANLLKKKLAESGESSYSDKNGVERKVRGTISHWVAKGTHAWGLAFDIDYPHNPYGTNTNIPQAAVAILTRDGFLKWGMGFKDPAHFQYSGPLCR